MTKKNKNKNQDNKTPFVSICTPTYNRRPFYPMIIKCFLSQKYPKDKMEWIIIDDGTDKIEDLVKDIPQVKYFKYDEKMTLGKKRNLAHEKSSGDILIYMDDDDFYPPERVSHAVETLNKNPKALCVGSSEMYIYFKHIDQMYRFGPYSKTHSTAATFAFRRELLKQTKYNETACVAEEREFLKDYTIPFAQLDPMKTILVCSHIHNSFDKKELLKTPNPFVNLSNKKVDDFIKDKDIKKFFLEDIDNILEKYDPGNILNKQDVLNNLDKIKTEREKTAMEEEKKQREINDAINKIHMFNANKPTQQPQQQMQQMQQMQQQQLFSQLPPHLQQSNPFANGPVMMNENEINMFIQQMMHENNSLKEKIQHLESRISQLIREQITSKTQIKI